MEATIASTATFWLRCLIPIHLTVKYTTPHDRCDDAGLRLDVTIEEGLVEFLDDFREGLVGGGSARVPESSPPFIPAGH